MVEEINRLMNFIYSLIFALCIFCFPCKAVASGMTLISDAETQNYLAAIIRPLFNAAGVRFDANKIFIVNDNSLNAFVSDGNYVFVHTGIILAADDTNELAGVLAHETGHIMGGHIVRQKLKLEKMQYVMLGSMIAAGATAVSTGRGDAAVAILLGSQSSALNNMLNYQMQEERSADESAVKLLNKTAQSTEGLLRFMNKIKRRNSLSGIEENAYFRTHPLTAERIDHFREASKNNHYSTANKLDDSLKLIQAKLSAFLSDTKKTERLYPNSDNSIPGRYAQSILNFRTGNIKTALDIIDGLIDERPNNPYFFELRGQFLFESGQVQKSISAYEKALELLPGNPLLQLSLAHALLEASPDQAKLKRIISLLQQSLVKINNPEAWQLLARAYDMSGNQGASYYAAAEFNYALDKDETALKLLQRAEKLPLDKSLHLKINDLKQRIENELKDKNKL